MSKSNNSQTWNDRQNRATLKHRERESVRKRERERRREKRPTIAFGKRQMFETSMRKTLNQKVESVETGADSQKTRIHFVASYLIDWIKSIKQFSVLVFVLQSGFDRLVGRENGWNIPNMCMQVVHINTLRCLLHHLPNGFRARRKNVMSAILNENGSGLGTPFSNTVSFGYFNSKIPINVIVECAFERQIFFCSVVPSDLLTTVNLLRHKRTYTRTHTQTNKRRSSNVVAGKRPTRTENLHGEKGSPSQWNRLLFEFTK